MAATYGFLSSEQFEALYREQKPHVEYWFGEQRGLMIPERELPN